MAPRDHIVIKSTSHDGRVANIWIVGGELVADSAPDSAHVVVCKNIDLVNIQVGQPGGAAWTNNMTKDQARALSIALMMAANDHDLSEYVDEFS